MAMSTAFPNRRQAKRLPRLKLGELLILTTTKVRRDVFRLLLHLCYYNSRMSAPIFTGSLWAVLPERTAIICNPGGQCAIGESCKAILCNDLL
jgi:hypothetical protein